jgi:signal transduction histidine kinase
LVILNDISELMKAEHIRASNKTQEMMTATTSHELKTPLNSINGMLTLLEDHVSSRDGMDYLHIASVSTKLMMSLVNDILDFS